MSTRQIITSCICDHLKQTINTIPEDEFKEIEEIRIRVNKPIIIYKNKKETLVDTKSFPTVEDIGLTLELMSDYSLYSLEEELKNGYITLQGGHRVGITGKAVIDKGSIKTLKNINGMNIRLSHQILGCANEIMKHIYEKNKICHTLIVSPPRCGKTTLLRDIVRQLSDGTSTNRGVTVAVVDERSEIAGCYKGIPQNDIGIRTDVLDACPKAEGIMLLLRSMSPEVIAVDEIGRREDIYAIEEVLNSGIKLICTVHGKTIEDILQKPVLSELMDKKIFEKVILLNRQKGAGTIEAIYDAKSYVRM
jgi:stage III sporulation protein AA